MEESREPRSADMSRDEGAEGAASPKRDEEATSSETLSDLEKSEKTTGAGGAAGSDTSSSLEGASPNPSGEGGGRADGSDSGGPM